VGLLQKVAKVPLSRWLLSAVDAKAVAKPEIQNCRQIVAGTRVG